MCRHVQRLVSSTLTNAICRACCEKKNILVLPFSQTQKSSQFYCVNVFCNLHFFEHERLHFFLQYHVLFMQFLDEISCDMHWKCYNFCFAVEKSIRANILSTDTFWDNKKMTKSLKYKAISFIKVKKKTTNKVNFRRISLLIKVVNATWMFLLSVNMSSCIKSREPPAQNCRTSINRTSFLLSTRVLVI